jgi:hypothetical protein
VATTHISGTVSAQQVAPFATNIAQSFPDPAGLTDIDALLDLGENATAMVRQLVPDDINSRGGTT